jgi:hypothetical protein
MRKIYKKLLLRLVLINSLHQSSCICGVGDNVVLFLIFHKNNELDIE